MRRATAYTVFAAIATAVNIGVQDIATRLYGGAFALLFSVAAGTLAGLVVKYILDKRYIFRFTANDAAHDARIFVLYSVMGVATTAIFWGFEFGFNHFFHSKELRYLGGVIGLATGYFAKYRLDKKFVFQRGAES
jgi:putative flippase GtrA